MRECGGRSGGIAVLVRACHSRRGYAKRWRLCQKKSARIGRRNEGNGRKELLGLENRSNPGFEKLRRAELGGLFRRLPSDRQTKSKDHPQRIPEDLRDDPQLRKDRVHRQQEAVDSISLLF